MFLYYILHCRNLNFKKMLPEEVGRLQTQLTDGELSAEQFFGLMMSMFEFLDAKIYLRTVIHNIRILVTETVWGSRYTVVYNALVGQYQEFFCEEIDHQENIEKYDKKDGLENSRQSVDEESNNHLFLNEVDEFLDDGGCLENEENLAFNLSREEVSGDIKLPTQPNSNTTDELRSIRRKRKKKGGCHEGPTLLWFRRDLRIHDNPALVTFFFE